MKKTTALIALFLFLNPPCVQAEIVDGIVAIVNNEIITQAELNSVLVPIYTQLKSTYNDEELLVKIQEAKNSILYQLIEDALILQEARGVQINVSEEEVDERLNQIKLQFSDENEFREALASQKLTVADLKEKYREQLMIQKIINREVRSRVSITPREVALFYEKNKGDFEVPAQALVKTVMIRKGVEGELPEADSLKRIKMVVQKLTEGADFSQLAREYSEDPSAVNGGDMGYINKGQMMKKIDEVIFELEPRQTSQIVETSIGYHIFKVVDIREPGIESFENVRPQIEDYLFQQKAKDRFEEWMSKLKENAYISVK